MSCKITTFYANSNGFMQKIMHKTAELFEDDESFALD